MSYRDFERGMTSQQVAYQRKIEEDRRLRSFFNETETLLKILRPATCNPAPEGELFQKWLHEAKRPIQSECEDWWTRTFPLSVSNYGPVFIGKTPNIEAIAASLGESPAKVVYSRSEAGFFFKDYSVDAFRPVSEGRLSALVKRIALEAYGKTTRSLGERFLEVRDLAETVVAAAKIILEVESDFFKGHGAARRYAAGRYIEPVEAPICRIFLDEQIVKKNQSVLELGDAYHRYYEFCSARSEGALPKTSFRKTFNHETKSRYGVGIRHDLRSATGRIFQGWEGLEFANVVIGKN